MSRPASSRVGFGDDEIVVHVGAQCRVFGGDGDAVAATGPPRVVTLLTWLIRPGRRLIAGSGDKDNGVAVVDGRERAVLEFAAKDAFAVRIGDLFELQGAFEGNGMGEAVPEMVWDGTGQLSN